MCIEYGLWSIWYGCAVFGCFFFLRWYDACDFSRLRWCVRCQWPYKRRFGIWFAYLLHALVSVRYASVEYFFCSLDAYMRRGYISKCQIILSQNVFVKITIHLKWMGLYCATVHFTYYKIYAKRRRNGWYRNSNNQLPILQHSRVGDNGLRLGSKLRTDFCGFDLILLHYLFGFIVQALRRTRREVQSVHK